MQSRSPEGSIFSASAELNGLIASVASARRGLGDSERKVGESARLSKGESSETPMDSSCK